jgi:GNAT superfamily N-acetyltransferase
VQEPERLVTALRMLDTSILGGVSQRSSRGDTWELYDATADASEAPVAVASTCPLDDGRSIELTAIAVASSRRRQGIGRRVIDDLSDALRARGAMSLVARVVGGDTTPASVLQRWGFRPVPCGGVDEPAAVGNAAFAIEL